MKQKLNIILSVCLFLMANFAFCQSKNDKIATYLNQLSSNDFSGTILAAHQNKIIEQRAFGFANVDYDVQNNTETKFNVAYHRVF